MPHWPSLALAATLLAAAPAQDAAPLRPWRLVWSDEFTGPANSPPDRTKWTFDLGNGQNGWGNQELENYTSSTSNAFLDGSGHLVIQVLAGGASALPCVNGSTCTSARLKTQGLVGFNYGKIEARIQVPAGQGMWPAFWMLGTNFGSVPWPYCGEMDIMENIGKEPAIVHGTVHGPGTGDGVGGAYTLPAGQRFSDGFHVFTIVWEKDSVEFQVDGHTYRQVTPADYPAGGVWVLNHPFFLLLNVAVGGAWPGNPDATTRFPQRMVVDWVRVYSRAGSTSLPVDR